MNRLIKFKLLKPNDKMQVKLGDINIITSETGTYGSLKIYFKFMGSEKSVAVSTDNLKLSSMELVMIDNDEKYINVYDYGTKKLSKTKRTELLSSLFESETEYSLRIDTQYEEDMKNGNMQLTNFVDEALLSGKKVMLHNLTKVSSIQKFMLRNISELGDYIRETYPNVQYMTDVFNMSLDTHDKVVKQIVKAFNKGV